MSEPLVSRPTQRAAAREARRRPTKHDRKGDDVKRRTVIKALAGVGLVPLAASCGSSSSSTTSKTYPLKFDTSSYTTETKTVSTGSGTRTIKYRFYRNNVYVQHPVNYKYQSLNVRDRKSVV